jgi:hypothetical protein
MLRIPQVFFELCRLDDFAHAASQSRAIPLSDARSNSSRSTARTAAEVDSFGAFTSNGSPLSTITRCRNKRIASLIVRPIFSSKRLTSSLIARSIREHITVWSHYARAYIIATTRAMRCSKIKMARTLQ